MKKSFYILICFIITAPFFTQAQRIAVNENGAAPDPSAMLDISDTTSGFLVPRITAAQRLLIPSPANGLLVFQTDQPEGFYVYYTRYSGWTRMTVDSALSLGEVLALNNNAKADTILNLNALRIGDISAPKSSVQIDSFLTIEGRGFDNVRWFGYNIYQDENDVRYLHDGHVGMLGFSADETVLANWQRGQKDSIIIDGPNSIISLRDSSISLSGRAQNFDIYLKGNTFTDSLSITGAFSFPTTDGAFNQVLKTDGSGILSWTSISDMAGWTKSGNYLYNLGDSIGIGTSTPSHPLHITADGGNQLLVEPLSLTSNDASISIRSHRNASTGSFHSQLHFENYDNDLVASHYLGSIVGRVSNSATNIGDLVFYNYSNGVTATEAMRIESTGDVGIGTSSPLAKLDVSGDVIFRGLNGFIFTDNTTIGNGFSFLVHDSDIGATGSPSLTLQFQPRNNANTGTTKYGKLSFTKYANKSASYFSLYTYSDAAGEAEVLRVDSAGKVGVGVSTPLNQLDVNGAITAREVSSIAHPIGNHVSIAPFSTSSFIQSATGSTPTALETQSLTFNVKTSTSSLAGGTSRIFVESGGDVGIGTTSPAQKLDVNGNIAVSGSTVHSSDKRFKKDIIPITSVLENILELKGVYYYWDTLNYPNRGFSSSKTIGLIAQDLQKYYPELVHTDKQGYLAVDYSKFSAVLLQAIKEQQFLIDQQNQNNEKQQYQIDFLIEEIRQLKEELNTKRDDK